VVVALSGSRTMIPRYKKLFRSSPEAAIFAVYGLVHLVLILAADEAEQIKAFLHILGLR
jgi:hypothetical protein